jgi:hypothetical protein
MNLTSHHEILTGKRQFDELSFQRSLVAERKFGLEHKHYRLWKMELHAGRANSLFTCNYDDKRVFLFRTSSHLCEQTKFPTSSTIKFNHLDNNFYRKKNHHLFM